MKNLFQPDSSEEIRRRIMQLAPDSKRQWGQMNPAQALTHCARALEIALGDRRPPRKFTSWILGPLVKRLALGNDEPMRRNTPTVPGLFIADDRDLATERTALLRMLDRFVGGGPAAITTHPHSFFGPLTADEWAVLQYKHLDHHLRQFGV